MRRSALVEWVCMEKYARRSLNHVLAGLPDTVWDGLAPKLETIDLPQGGVLYEHGELIHHVWFPLDTVIDLLCETSNGKGAEIAMIGCDSVVGITALASGRALPGRALVRCAGQAQRLSLNALREAARQNDTLRYTLFSSLQALISQIAQNALCNRHHSLQQRLCRWLLMSLDCLPGSAIETTQSDIAERLGVRREGITGGARKLHDLGAIHCHRGHIDVLDRKLLECLCCECYADSQRSSHKLSA